jgi:hypothetical protein
MIAPIMGKVDCSAAELLAVNPFAPMAQARCRGFGRVTARLGRRNERHQALKGNAYRLQSQSMKSRRAGPGALAP